MTTTKKRSRLVAPAATLEQRLVAIQRVFRHFEATEQQPAIFSVSGFGKRAAKLNNPQARALLLGEANTARPKLTEARVAALERLLGELAQVLRPFEPTPPDAVL